MKLEKFSVGMLETNGYIIYDDENLEALIIDPGDEARSFIEFINKNTLQPVGIILTHHHYDHIGAVEELKEKYKCPVYIHKKDFEGLKEPSINHSIRGFRKPISITADKIVSDGDKIVAGKVILTVVHTPGHTEGCISLVVEGEDIIFTGDTIFRDDIGRMDLEGGSQADMKKSIVNKVNKWEDSKVIYPGHGESGTMEYVRKKNRSFLYMVR